MCEVETRAAMKFQVGMDTALFFGVMEIRTSGFWSVWRLHGACREGEVRLSICQENGVRVVANVREGPCVSARSII